MPNFMSVLHSSARFFWGLVVLVLVTGGKQSQLLVRLGLYCQTLLEFDKKSPDLVKAVLAKQYLHLIGSPDKFYCGLLSIMVLWTLSE